MKNSSHNDSSNPSINNSSSSIKYQNENVKAAMALKEFIEFTFRDKTYKFPHVINKRFVMGP